MTDDRSLTRKEATTPVRRSVSRIATYFVLILGSAIVLVPFLWTIGTAVKPPEQVYLVPPQWIPHPVMWGNFAKAWSALPFTLFLRNTMFVTVMCLIGQITSASLVAYGFARFKFTGRTALFYVLLGTMMLPSQVTMIPTFLIWRNFRLIDTFWPLIVPAYLGGGAFTIFLLRQFFMTIPRDLDEAAMIDGCSYFGIWWRIILPLSKPALTTVVIFSFISHWDDFMGPLIYLHSMDKYTVSIGLRMFQDMYGTQLDQLMAASLIHITPCIILFFAAQRYFIKGIVMSGIKG
jgi:multiple sugar transport system permease protein